MSNVELWKPTDQESAEVLFKRRRWTWIGHTFRKPRDNITRRALQWNPQGQRNRGRPKNTWRRGVEQEMNEAGVTWGSLVAAAQDRVKWKQFVGGLCSTSGVIKA